MSRRVEISGEMPPPVASRKQPLILKGAANPSKRVAEVAGGMAAECAVVVCCCPCGLLNLLVLAVVKLPAGLCRRAMKRRKRREAGRKKKAGLLKSSGVETGAASVDTAATELPCPAKSLAAEVSEMEKEMWPQFFGAGFWRSESQSD